MVSIASLCMSTHDEDGVAWKLPQVPLKGTCGTEEATDETARGPCLPLSMRETCREVSHLPVNRREIMPTSTTSTPS